MKGSLEKRINDLALALDNSYARIRNLEALMLDIALRENAKQEKPVEFIPGKFYKHPNGSIVMCTGSPDDECFSGYQVNDKCDYTARLQHHYLKKIFTRIEMKEA